MLKIHIVKKGDTLYEIAQKHRVELDKLIAANPHIANPDQLDVGMKVKIPFISKPVPVPPASYSHKHVVVQGDTLWKLSKQWNVPLKSLIDANPHIKNPSVLMTGDVIYIPKLHADSEEHSMSIHTADPKGTAPKGTDVQEPAVLPPENVPPAEEAPAEMPPVNPAPVPAPVAEEAPAEAMPEKEKEKEKAPEIEAPEFQMQAVPLEEPIHIQAPMIDKDLPMEQMPKKAEKEGKAAKPETLCPPLPELTGAEMQLPKFDANMYMAETPFTPFAQPESMHPFAQYQLPAVEAALPYDYNTAIPAHGADAGNQPHFWNEMNMPLPQIPGMPQQAQGAFPVFEHPVPKADCGCGGGAAEAAGFSLPYALPYMHMQQPFAGAAPYMAMPLPYMQPQGQMGVPAGSQVPSAYAADQGYPEFQVHGMSYSPEQLMFPEDYPAQHPGYGMAMGMMPGYEFPGIAAPFANPMPAAGYPQQAYPAAFPGMKSEGDCGCGREDGEGEVNVNGIAALESAHAAASAQNPAAAAVQEKAKASEKPQARGGSKTKSSGRHDALYTFLHKRKAKAARQQAKVQSPWTQF